MILSLVSLTVLGCTDSARHSFDTTAVSGNNGQDVPVPKGLDSRAATNVECVTGGQVYIVYVDLNANGVRETDETVVSSQIVCNGIDGSDGKNGANGADGADGLNGHSLVSETVGAPRSVCAAGGAVILLALDINDSGIYSLSLPHQSAVTVCNGLNGSDAPVSAYSFVEPIYACGNSVSYKEVLLRLQSGQVLGSFSRDASGAMTRLAFLPDGQFMNTDESGCAFSLSTSADGLTRYMSWSGAAQMSWAMH